MKLARYKEASEYDVLNKIKTVLNKRQNFQMDYNTREELKEVLKHYKIFCWDGRVKQSPLWRLTIPFYLLFWVILIILIMPCKWLLTGTIYYEEDGWFLKFIRFWQIKLGF